MTERDEAVLILRNYIAGCIGRARWYRKDGRMRADSYDAAVREVRTARRLSQWVRRELHGDPS